MSLELAPEAENRIRQHAEAEGVSVSALIDQHFPPLQRRHNPVARVRDLLRQWQQEDGTPSAPPAPHNGSLTPSEALFRKWDAEDAHLTEADRQAQAEQWHQFQHDINTERSASNSPLVF